MPFFFRAIWNLLTAAFLFSPVFLHAFPPGKDVYPFQMGFEIETDDFVMLRLSPWIDWEAFASEKESLSTENFKNPFPLVTPEDIRRLPERIRLPLTQDLNLETVSIQQESPKSILGPDGNVWSNNWVTSPSKLKVSKTALPVSPSSPGYQERKGLLVPKGLEKGENEGVARLSDWEILAKRWQSLWGTLTLYERRNLFPVEALGPLARVNLFRSGLKHFTKGKKNLSMPVPLKKDVPAEVRDVFSRVVVSLDVSEAIEWRHKEPVDDLGVYFSDLDTFSRITQLKEQLYKPQEKNKDVFSYHVHWSDKRGRDLRPFRKLYRKLQLLRMVDQKRADQVLGWTAVGNVQYSEGEEGDGNDIVRMARTYDDKGQVTGKEIHHFEIKSHTTDPRSELREIEELLLAPEYFAEIYHRMETLLTRENYEEILKRNISVATEFLLVPKIQERAKEHLKAISSDNSPLGPLALLLLSRANNEHPPLSLLELPSSSFDRFRDLFEREMEQWMREPDFRRKVIPVVKKSPGIANRHLFLNPILQDLSPAESEFLYTHLNEDKRQAWLLRLSGPTGLSSPGETAFLLKAMQDESESVRNRALMLYPLLPDRPFEEMAAVLMKLLPNGSSYVVSDLIKKLSQSLETEPRVLELFGRILNSRNNEAIRTTLIALLNSEFSPAISHVLFRKEFEKFPFNLQTIVLEALPRNFEKGSLKYEALALGLLKHASPLIQAAALVRSKNALSTHPEFLQFLEKSQHSEEETLRKTATEILRDIRPKERSPLTCEGVIRHIEPFIIY